MLILKLNIQKKKKRTFILTHGVYLCQHLSYKPKYHNFYNSKIIEIF